MHSNQGRPKLSRALRMRCPYCGHRPIRRGFGELVDRCAGCGVAFEQGESGFYVGAMIMSMALCILMFIATFGIGLALTWPDVPWQGLTYVCLVTVGLTPIWFYPRSKTVWIWLDARIHPYTEDERPAGTGRPLS